jgi:hypothetical protein
MDQPIAYDPTMAHPSMMHPMDGYMYQHAPFDMIDFYHQPIMDYEEYAENLSRPRLTKEQVETLEAQFQAHPKPSSNVKRQLAAQTNLSLPRVAVSDIPARIFCDVHRHELMLIYRTGFKIDEPRPSSRSDRKSSRGCRRRRQRPRKLHG